MNPIFWTSFAAEIPGIESHLLPHPHMDLVQDLSLNKGSLDPIFGPSLTAPLDKPGTKMTIRRWPNSLVSDSLYWFHWLTDVDMTKGPLKNDTQERVFYTGDGVPKWTDSTMATGGAALPFASMILGIPAPSAPTIAASGVGSGVAQTVLTAYAFVNSIGEIGPLSPASGSVSMLPGQTITVSGMDSAPPGAYNFTQKYVYLSQTDSNGNTEFRFWKSVGIGVASTAGLIGILVESPISPSPIAPPVNLFGLGLHPNGFLYGFTKNKFHRSDVFRPYAWPDAYVDPIGDDIIGGVAFGSSIAIITDKGAKLATGVDPLNQNISTITGAMPGVSKRSIAMSERGVYYVVPSGIGRITPNGGFELLTEGRVDLAWWQARSPASMHAVLQDERYFVWWDNGTIRGLMIFDFRSNSFALTESTVYASAAYVEPRTLGLFMALPPNDTLYKWDAGSSKLTMKARSAEIRLNHAQNVGGARVRASGYPLTFRFYGNGTLRSTRTVLDDKPFTLNGSNSYNRCYWEVSSTFKITEVGVASCVEDFANV